MGDVAQDARRSQPRLAERRDDTFSASFALSHHSPSSPAPSSDPMPMSSLDSAKPQQAHLRIRLPIHHQRDPRRKESLLGPNNLLNFGPLEPTPLGFSPALAGLTNTNRGDGHSQLIPALLPSPLEDTDGPPLDQPSDLITPTPKIFHSRTGYFGQDALERLKHNRPARSGRASTAHLVQNSAHRIAPSEPAAAAPDVPIVSPAPKYPNLLSFPIRPSFTTRSYSGVPVNSLRERLSAIQPPSQTLDLPLEPSPRFRTPQLAASDSSSPSNGSELPTPSTRHQTPAPLPLPFLPSNSPRQRPSPAQSPAPSSRSLSSASRSASRCSSSSGSKPPLRIESHPRLGAISVAPQLKKSTPPPVPTIPEKYRRERSAERWLKPPDNRGRAEGRRGSGGSLGTLRQARSMENLGHIGYKMEDEAADKVKEVNDKHASRSLTCLVISIPNIICEPPSCNDQGSEETGKCASSNSPVLDGENITLAPSLPRSRSPSVLVHGPVLHVDETFEEGMNWLHIKGFQGGSGEIQVEKTPNWFERSRTPSPISAASPYLTAFHSPAGSAGYNKVKPSGPGALAKKLSGSFVKVSRGLRHVTSSSGLGIMIGQEAEPNRSSSSTKGSKPYLDGRITPNESASLSSSSDSALFSGRNDSWRGQSDRRYRGSKWSARDPVIRSSESEPSISAGGREGVRLVDFLNEVSAILALQGPGRQLPY